MLNFIKRIIPLRWKLAVITAMSSRNPPANFPLLGPRLIVTLCADYGNLGDVALTRALVQFAMVHLPSHQPYLLCAGRVFRDLKGVAEAAHSEDVVVIVGGGNMGDLYPYLEEARLSVIKAFPQNQIISFPQSIEFSKTASGRRALARSRAVYENHPHLEIFARDFESLRQMQKAFPRAKVSCAPDTVLSMAISSASSRDMPLMICLRQDKEAALDTVRRQEILDALISHVPDAIVTDTVVTGPRLDYASYDKHLDGLLGQFSRTRCVVTDRLHGLIFAVISGTPCVVIENNNHKIRGLVSTWLSDVRSIRLLTNPDVSAVLAAVSEVTSIAASRPNLDVAFAPLASALKR